MTRHDETVPPTPHRIAKGDLDVHRDRDGNFLSVGVKDRSVLHDLIQRGILDELHRAYAITFQEMYAAFTRQSGYKRANDLDRHSEDQSEGQFAMAYLKVCRELGRNDERVVRYAIETTASPANLRMLLIGAKGYKQAFDALVDAIDNHRPRSSGPNA